MKSRMIFILSGCLLLGGSVNPSQARPMGGSTLADGRIDYEVTRREIQKLESLINNVIGTTFVNPFALVQKTKGVYLQGYGVTFSFLVNIHRAIVDTPFGTQKIGTEITVAEKKRRIDELADKMVRLLLNNVEILRQIRRDESVTIVAFFEDRTFLDEKNQNKTLIMRAFKKDLEEFTRQENRWKELKQRMEYVEY